MNLEELRSICLSLPHVTEDIKWKSNLCFCVGGKIFMIVSIDELPITAAFKASDDDFNQLMEHKGFRPSPYLAKHRWVAIDDITRLNSSDWKQLARQAYLLIRSKLPLKVRKNLDL